MVEMNAEDAQRLVDLAEARDRLDQLADEALIEEIQTDGCWKRIGMIAVEERGESGGDLIWDVDIDLPTFRKLLPHLRRIINAELQKLGFSRENAVGDIAPGVEMPRYQCHKKVWALKIKQIDFQYGEGESSSVCVGAKITPEEEGYAAFQVDGAYCRKHEPKAGGYYVVYDDGYKSYSPAEPFEDGYTAI